MLFLLASSASAKSWTIDGIIVATDVPAGTMTVAHRPVTGFMPAMTMRFRVRSAVEVRPVSIGDRVRFTFDGAYARNVKRIQVDEAGMPISVPPLRPGSSAPDFTLVDQLGRPVQLSKLRGRVVCLNFIYSRCPVPEACPRLGAAFAMAHNRFVYSDLILLSISIDPLWDTPSVLAEYAKRWGAQSDRWRFLTGSADTVASVGRDFGLLYWPEDGSLTHTSRTYVIGRDGTVSVTLEGTSWRADQLTALIAKELEGP